MEGTIQIKDILKRPVFSHAIVVAGSAGLNRSVRWVHVLEVTKIRTLIRGDELVLTTGTGFQADESAFLEYVNELIDSRAAGLCIELGRFKEVPQAVLELADTNQFPVIVFPVEVRFVDITEDIHRYILNRHHKLMDDLEQTARKLQDLTFHEAATRQVLSILHQATGYPIVFSRTGQRPYFEGTITPPIETIGEWLNESFSRASSPTEPEIRTLANPWSGDANGQPFCFVTRALFVLGDKKGLLAFICPQNAVNEYLILLMDKALSILAQHEFHRITVQERQVFYEQNLVDHLLRGEVDPVSLEGFPHSRGPSDPQPGSRGFTVFLLQTHQNLSLEDENWFNQRTEIAMSIKQTFNKFNFKTFLAVSPGLVTVILEPTPHHKDLKVTLEQLLDELDSPHLRPWIETKRARGGLGRTVQDLRDIRQSYDDALLAMKIAGESTGSPVVLYEEAGVYRWLALLIDEERMQRLVQLDVGAIVKYDMEHGTELLHTLKTYLDCNQSKQKTADALFIHRQTLYHRLEQIERLQNCNLDDAKIRLSLHLSLYYNEYHPFKKQG